MNSTASTTATRSYQVWALTIVWFFLIGISLLNYFLAENNPPESRITQFVLAASFVKLTLIAGSFMELWSKGRGFFYLAVGLFCITLGLIAITW